MSTQLEAEVVRMLEDVLELLYQSLDKLDLEYVRNG